MDHALSVSEGQCARDVLRDANDVALREGTLSREACPQAVGAQVHREVDVGSGLGHRADVHDVGVLELSGGFALVPKPRLEVGIAGVARLQHLHRDRRAVGFPSDEDPRETALADESLQVVGAERSADEIGGRAGHGAYVGALQRARASLT